MDSILNVDLPLVSIVVITYNSSKFVLETLESAKIQTYQNIELIVSDDCSTDNTVEICNNWINENIKRFKRTKLITHHENTGISSNCNRGILHVKGIWTKLIAGDDILLDNCISSYINFALQNIEAYIIGGNHISFTETQEHKILFNVSFIKLTANQQLNYIIRYGSPILGATPIIRTELYKKIGDYNERYPFYEDTPFFIKILQAGYKFYSINEFVIKYRDHEESISQTKVNSKFIDSHKKYFKEKVIPLSLLRRMYLYYWHHKLLYYIYDRIEIPPFKSLLYRRLILLIIDPYIYIIKIRKFFSK